MKPRQRRRGQRRLKNQFMFYLRISQYCKVVINVVTTAKLNPEHSNKFDIKMQKLAVVVHVLQMTQNLVISRRRFAEDDKEMYQEL